MSTLDWSEVPEGILHYEVPHVSGDGGDFLIMFGLKMMMEAGDRDGWYFF